MFTVKYAAYWHVSKYLPTIAAVLLTMSVMPTPIASAARGASPADDYPNKPVRFISPFRQVGAPTR